MLERIPFSRFVYDRTGACQIVIIWSVSEIKYRLYNSFFISRKKSARLVEMDLCIVQPRARNVPKSAVQMFENRAGSTRVTVKNFVNTVPLKSRCGCFAPCVLPRPHSRPLYAQTYNCPKILAVKYSGPSEGVRQSVMDLAAVTDLSDSISKVRRFNYSYRRRLTQHLCFYPAQRVAVS